MMRLPQLLLATGTFGALLAMAWLMPSTPASAQAPGIGEKDAPIEVRPLPKAKSPTPKAEAQTPASPTGDAALRKRVQTLEEQLTDIQVIIGTLESLMRSRSATPGANVDGAELGTVNGGEAARIEGLEAQVRALTAQVAKLSETVQQQSGQRTATPSVAPPATPPVTPPVTPPTERDGFGKVTVTPGDGDPIDSLIAGDPTSTPPGWKASPRVEGPEDDTIKRESVPDPVGTPKASPKQLYETSYGYMLQQDYAAAEVAFTDFLTKYPNDSLSSNAQYFLGESYFQRGRFKEAASAFLKGYETYAKSAKAPDNLLKLAVSLDRLGQKEASCSSFDELTSRFPNASASLKSRAQAERQKVGC